MRYLLSIVGLLVLLASTSPVQAQGEQWLHVSIFTRLDDGHLEATTGAGVSVEQVDGNEEYFGVTPTWGTVSFLVPPGTYAITSAPSPRLDCQATVTVDEQNEYALVVCRELPVVHLPWLATLPR
jgi:hypothetical protein